MQRKKNEDTLSEQIWNRLQGGQLVNKRTEQWVSVFTLGGEGKHTYICRCKIIPESSIRNQYHREPPAASREGNWELADYGYFLNLGYVNVIYSKEQI